MIDEKEFIICSLTDLPSKYTNKKKKAKSFHDGIRGEYENRNIFLSRQTEYPIFGIILQRSIGFRYQ